MRSSESQDWISGLLLDPRNGPHFDQELGTGPIRNYVVASTPRSGSTLLCNRLWDAGGMGAPKEYLNPMQIRDWELRFGGHLARGRNLLLWGPAVNLLAGRLFWDRERVGGHLERVRTRRSGGGWFGLKLHFHHWRRWSSVAPLETLLGSEISWIHIQRADRLGQAISWVRALQTQQWASFQRPLLPAHYDRRAIARAIEGIAEHEAGWEQVLRGKRVLELSYEGLVAEPAKTLGLVADFLGVERPIRRSADDLRRQSDGNTTTWRARFIQETGYSSLPPPL